MEQKVINEFVMDSIDELKSVDRKYKKFSELMSKHNPYELSVFCDTPKKIVDLWVNDDLFHYRGWKSSPKWCNADQKKRVNIKVGELKENNDFGSFKVLTSYGKTTKKNTEKNFTQLSGQDSWYEISNDPEMYNKVMIAIVKHSKYLNQVIEDIYSSNVKESVEWVDRNFTNKDKTINFIKINEYVSGRNKVTVS